MNLAKRLEKLEHFIQTNKYSTEKLVCKYLLAVCDGAEQDELEEKFRKVKASNSNIPILHKQAGDDT